MTQCLSNKNRKTLVASVPGGAFDPIFTVLRPEFRRARRRAITGEI